MSTITASAFTDTSIEKGVREYADGAGATFRAERDADGATWRMYLREGNTLSFIAAVKCKSSNPLALHRAMLAA